MAINKKLKNRFQKSKLFNKRGALYFALIFVAVGAYLVYRTFAATTQGTYSTWYFPTNTAGFTSMEHSLQIEDNDPSSKYFWSRQFWFLGGDGGYIGLQSQGNRIDGTVGKSAIFSIFSSGLEATAGNCRTQQSGFDGYNISGSSCIIAYEWVQGRIYHLRSVMTGNNSVGTRTYWSGYVKDTVTNVETFIGRIAVPKIWGNLKTVGLSWTEYFGPEAATCEAIPYSKVKFFPPTANGGRIISNGHLNQLSTDRDCTNSKVTDTAGGVIQEMGNVANSYLGGQKAPVSDVNIDYSASYAFATCFQKITKATGSVNCSLTAAYPTYKISNLQNTTVATNKFCFHAVRSTNAPLKVRVSAGRLSTSSASPVYTYTINDDKTHRELCVPTTGVFTSSTLNNYAQITVTSGTALVVGAQSVN